MGDRMRNIYFRIFTLALAAGFAFTPSSYAGAPAPEAEPYLMLYLEYLSKECNEGTKDAR